MHRATPVNTSFRAFSAGGARSVVDKVNDGSLMQEMAGNFMKGETRDKVEAPQNYGFTSVVADATKGKDGQIEESAEAFMSFIGGNRSFPVAGIMDDRRHRLKELEKGDTALFGLKDWGQQFHINKTGMFMSGSTDRKIRFALVDNDDHNSGKAYQKDGAQARAGESGGGDSQADKAKKAGQKKLYDKTSDTEIEVTKGAITIKRGGGHVVVKADSVLAYVGSESNSMLVDSTHTHIRCGGNRIFVDQQGCWSTKEIAIKPDPTADPVTMPTPTREQLLARIVRLEAAVTALRARR